MYKTRSDYLRKMAHVIIKQVCPDLDAQDRVTLLKDGSRCLRHVRANIKMKNKPLEGLSETEQRILFAYIVFLRQNVTTGPGDRPNEEDAAKILHGELYEGKNEGKDLEKNLLKQLEKIGIQTDSK